LAVAKVALEKEHNQAAMSEKKLKITNFNGGAKDAEKVFNKKCGSKTIRILIL
jgi:hypothetical protein